MHHPECPSFLIPILQGKINPVIIGAARYALRCYEFADDKNLGFRQCTNFTLGCAFYDSCSERLKQLAKEENSIIRYEVQDEQQQVIVSVEGAEYPFFTGRVHPITRQLIGGKGKKRFLDDQLDAACWLGLPGIAERNVARGMYVIGADFSSKNGLGRITLDYHTPLSKGNYSVETVATLFDSENPIPIFSSTPEKIFQPTAAKKLDTEKKAQAKKKATILKMTK